MQYIDQPVVGRKAIMSPDMAVISGLIKTDGLDDLRSFSQAFALDPRKLVALSRATIAREAEGRNVTKDDVSTLLSAKDKTDMIFKDLMPAVYREDAASGWDASMYFNIEGAGDYTLSVDGGEVEVQEGRGPAIDTEVAMDSETFNAVLRYQALEEANQMDAVEVIDDEDASEELSDYQLELVAGGKGNANACGAEACGNDNSGASACGAALGLATACGVDACGAAFAAAGVCGIDACVADACAADVCFINVIPVLPFF